MDKKRVVIVDDQPSFTRYVKTVLENTGVIEVIECNHSRAAIGLLTFTKPDLILMDLHMPGLDGMELASIASNVEAIKDIPLIFLTGIVGSDEFDQSGEPVAGYIFLNKPVEVTSFLGRVGDTLGVALLN